MLNEKNTENFLPTENIMREKVAQLQRKRSIVARWMWIVQNENLKVS